jgi:hypothetical protein
MSHTASARELLDRLATLAQSDPVVARGVVDDLVAGIDDATGHRYAGQLAQLHVLAIAGIDAVHAGAALPDNRAADMAADGWSGAARVRPFRGGYGDEPERVAELNAWAAGTGGAASDGTMPEGDDPEPASGGTKS